MSSDLLRHSRFNFTVGVLNGSFFMFGVAFMSPTTVLPDFISEFTDSKAIIGFTSVLHVGCWCLPQILAAGWIERFQRQKMPYFLGNAGRLILAAAAFVCIFALCRHHPSLGLALFMLLYGVSMMSGGVAGLAFTSMVGAIIPPHRRAAFFSVRFLIGGSVFTILAGAIIKAVLADTVSFAFPWNYEALFGVGWLMMALGTACMLLTKEDISDRATTSRPILAGLYRAPAILRSDSRLRILLWNRMLSMGSRMSWPFFIILARQDLGLAKSTVGTFLMVQTVGALLGNICWGLLAGRLGHRFIIRACSGMDCGAPLYAAMVGVWLRLYGQGLSPDGVTLALFPIFFLMGATWHGSFVGVMSYILDIAPERRRPTYIGILNTAVGFGTLAPVLGGLIAGWLGLTTVFALSALCGIAGLWVSFQLAEHP